MKIATLAAAAAATFAMQAAAQVTFYEHEGFQGRSFTSARSLENLDRYGFNDRASSVVVVRSRWEVCENARFGGRCVVLRPGRYSSLGAMGLNDRVSSMRIVGRDARVKDDRYAPPAPAFYDTTRRRDERLFQADVTSVRAIVGPGEQRCWVEREQVSQERGGTNVPGAVIGALIGGVLGHQVGSGRGNDAATAGGAVVGGLVGANVGRDGGSSTSQNVERCSTAQSARPDHWDVTYVFRGQEHRIQTTAPPGRTITVNAEGEPRV